MLDTAWTFISLSKMTITEFVTVVRTSMPMFFAEDESDIQDILGYIADCPAIGQPTMPIPAFPANGVQLVNDVLTKSVEEIIARQL